MKSYVNRKLTFTNEGRLLDEDGKSIMMDWEKPIMEFQAEHISKNGGDILNIGYGMGLIDEEIQKKQIKSHTIIEIHPDVQNKMKEVGWHTKNNVKLLFGDWKDFLNDLPKFDGIYFDTWDDRDLLLLIKNLKKILKPNGVMTFFNNPKDDELGIGYPNYLKELIEKDFNVEFQDLELKFIDTPYRQTGDPDSCYWSPYWTIYRSPILSIK